MDNFLFSKIRRVKSPDRKNKFDAGLDFYIPDDFKEVVLMHGQSILIPSGIKVNIPKNFVFIAFNKSGVASKKKLDVLASVIDEIYQGEIHINLINNGEEPQIISPGDKIIQFLLLPISYQTPIEVLVKDLYKESSDRGENGFGSTGEK